ncbi:MAG: 30S ribosomal protein S13 [Candidatus Ryanbacteria bacterium RIFCSPHIGHO2_02_FULL_48_12]|jgi:small subunit ribosomal protein S13|uniref:Small ribosomal subunit protein uS13 n=1 Tax=Candidatus Ryanbacteria bacterium RIFCSPHIGHO2_01_FULL_48_27 TaxID=1802115 RepID=A0A1G2G0F4_9BACT|nr:MAG: 30S ribosomal protein S13 [Candidatus Ryanbacteria bacterium RIFCSPHIGHO2_01_FULL_48_27]OGZ48522.1 MAG: 30S ribosomal protein S13 [Candidatus Ryanbacteria bacterium RIFCSPHIGHO2_02_FULL_48_12]
MVRIAGVTIPDEKQIRIALTYIYGIGRALSAKILVSAKIDPFKRTAELNATEVAALRDIIEKTHKIEGDLRREIMMNIKRLKDIAAYRGTRHMRGLPVRGQRTKTNSRTRRGNVRKTMGSGKRSVEKK